MAQGFLADVNGDPSAMRLMSMIGLIASLGLGGYAVTTGSVIAMELAKTLLLSSFGGKLGQRAVEELGARILSGVQGQDKPSTVAPPVAGPTGNA